MLLRAPGRKYSCRLIVSLLWGPWAEETDSVNSCNTNLWVRLRIHVYLYIKLSVRVGWILGAVLVLQTFRRWRFCPLTSPPAPPAAANQPGPTPDQSIAPVPDSLDWTLLVAPRAGDGDGSKRHTHKHTHTHRHKHTQTHTQAYSSCSARTHSEKRRRTRQLGRMS